jgi:tetratricopeptide (TPR) repeat protein
MLKNRIILVAVCAVLIWLLFMLPKVVVQNESELASAPSDSTAAATSDPHDIAPEALLKKISEFQTKYREASENQKKAIFADSLTSLYAKTGKFDSAGWYAEQVAKFFNNENSWVKAGEMYYQAYTFALDQTKQGQLAEKTREYLGKVLEVSPQNLEAKTKIAMTYLSSGNPMQGITMLREVLAEDPKNESALFNLGMLSIQSGQYDKAVDRLKELVEINPNHVQGQLLLGIALMNSGDKKGAKAQFEKVKDMDKDPAVQATVDSYLSDLK